MTTTGSSEVLVVGGGVVGLATALAVQRSGLHVVVADAGAPPARPPTDYDARVYALSPGSISFLEQLGVWPQVRAHRVSPFVAMQVWGRDPRRSLKFSAAEFARTELGCIVEERVLRFALWSALDRQCMQHHKQAVALERLRSRSVVRFDDDSEAVATLVVAADGAQSQLRGWADIGVMGQDHHQRALVCHVQTAQPHRETAWQRFVTEGPLAFLPLEDGRSSIVWSVPEEVAAHLMALDDATFCERVGTALDGPPGEVLSCSRRHAFALQLLHAERYVAPGLALVGDSAHVIHPLAGQGVNLGLADAEALASVLTAAQQRGQVLDSLRVLRRYERARRGANLEMVAVTEGLNRLYQQKLPVVENLRELGLSVVDALNPLKRRLAARAMGLR